MLGQLWGMNNGSTATNTSTTSSPLEQDSIVSPTNYLNSPNSSTRTSIGLQQSPPPPPSSLYLTQQQQQSNLTNGDAIIDNNGSNAAAVQHSANCSLASNGLQSFNNLSKSLLCDFFFNLINLFDFIVTPQQLIPWLLNNGLLSPNASPAFIHSSAAVISSLLPQPKPQNTLSQNGGGAALSAANQLALKLLEQHNQASLLNPAMLLNENGGGGGGDAGHSNTSSWLQQSLQHIQELNANNGGGGGGSGGEASGGLPPALNNNNNNANGRLLELVQAAAMLQHQHSTLNDIGGGIGRSSVTNTMIKNEVQLDNNNRGGFRFFLLTVKGYF